MTTSYDECDHQWRLWFESQWKCWTAGCITCELRTFRAPWSYCELIAAIGLQALYRSAMDTAIKGGIQVLDERNWIASTALFVMQPSQYILALQAGVQLAAAPFKVVQMPARPQPGARLSPRGRG